LLLTLLLDCETAQFVRGFVRNIRLRPDDRGT
jgi:hypothetical protein